MLDAETLAQINGEYAMPPDAGTAICETAAPFVATVPVTCAGLPAIATPAAAITIPSTTAIIEFMVIHSLLFSSIPHPAI